MNAFKLFAALLCAVFLAQPSWAEEKKEQKGPTPIVIGKSLKVGMPLEKAISLLGVPKTINIRRGTEPETDSLSIEYPEHGIVIHALTRKTAIEEIEVLHTFKGRFADGLKIGSKFPGLMEKYGMPQSVKSHIARYPKIGMYFFLKNDTLVSVKVFAKNSKLFDYKMLQN